MCTKDLRLFIQERTPDSIKKLIQLAEGYLEVHGRLYSQWSSRDSKGKSERQEQRQKTTSGSSHQSKSQDKGEERPVYSGPRKCYMCGSERHIIKDCPLKQSAKTQTTALACRVIDDVSEVSGRCDDVNEGSSHYITLKGGHRVPVIRVDGKSYVERQEDRELPVLGFAANEFTNLTVKLGRVCNYPDDVKVLRDTGCTTVVVRRSLCQPDDFTGIWRPSKLLDGSIVENPEVKIRIDTPYYKGEVKALAMLNPVYDIVVGNIPGAREAHCPDPAWKPKLPVAASATTTSQDRQQARLSTGDKSREYHINLDQVRQLQKSDESLAKIRTWVDEGRGKNPREGRQEHYFWDQTQLLMREHVNKKTGVRSQQLVLPGEFRDRVMEVAHGSSHCGHLGVKETVDEVLSSFYWPSIHGDVTWHCQSCDVCQKASSGGKRRRNKGRKKILQPGDQVLLHQTSHQEGTSWKGPYVILKQVSDKHYIIRMEQRDKTFHGNRLKRYFSRSISGKPDQPGAEILLADGECLRKELVTLQQP